MKKLNHILIANAIDVEFGLTSYSRGKFIYFVKDNCEIGFIEQIPASKLYLRTIYTSFFCFDDLELNNKICNRIKELYKEQAKESLNIELAFANEDIWHELI